MTETYDVQTAPQFTKDSPRPLLQVAVGISGGDPVASIGSLYYFFQDSADWNLVAGDPGKVLGLEAAARAMYELFPKVYQQYVSVPAVSDRPGCGGAPDHAGCGCWKDCCR